MLCREGVTQDCWQSILSQVCSYTECSLSCKWLRPMLSKISPPPLTAHSLPRTSILQSKFQLSLNLLSPGEFFCPTLWERFWTRGKLFLFLAWNYFFKFYMPTLERRLGIGWEAGKEGRDSEATWGNVLLFHCRKLFISRAVPVHHSLLQKTHQLCEFISRFLLQRCCGSLLRWGFPLGWLSAALRFLPTQSWRSPNPMQSLQRFFHCSQRRAMLTLFLFSFYIPALCPSLPLQKVLLHGGIRKSHRPGGAGVLNNFCA